MQQAQDGFFPDLPTGIQETLSKKGFAERVGVSPGRVSQLITAGLPVQPNGRIAVKDGLAWYAANVDSNRSRAALDEAVMPRPTNARARRDAAEAETAELKAGKLRGDLINRKAALGAVEARARLERDSWLAWVNRAAPALASALGADARTILGPLDELVREQLASLADLPIDRLQR